MRTPTRRAALGAGLAVAGTGLLTARSGSMAGMDHSAMGEGGTPAP
ncbi:hypothetical protein QEZ40_000334 [Streptomyces katrae]|uniref:Copper oxidase n=1 Tax=Streptomyces katrae TaxID=68223 RepID=A0ABT7GLJ5_9ACTN|nr:hypothetical protein [Streptomyces katrae]MDK9494457.1 hypothetical protein [Streptomyces katrae]